MFSKGIYVFIAFLVLITNLNAYESEEKIEVLVVGKVSKFVKWERDRKKEFVITILDNQHGDLFDTVYKNKKIQKRPVKIVYISDINDLKFTHVLFVPKISSKKLEKLLKKIKNKNILLISNIRGFAQKGGVIQISFISQKPKLKVNIYKAKKNHLKVSSSLLRISEVVKGK